MDTGSELFVRLSAWCKEHRFGVRNRNQWKDMVLGAAVDIHQELIQSGSPPLGESHLYRIASNAEQWWWKQNSHSAYGRARSSHGKGNPLKPTVLDSGID